MHDPWLGKVRNSRREACGAVGGKGGGANQIEELALVASCVQASKPL